MIRIECFVDNKHLGEVVELLTGKVMNLTVQAVVNATVSKGKVVASGERQHGYVRVFGRLKRNGKEPGHKVTATEIKEAMTDEHMNVSSYSSVSATMREAGMLKALQRGLFVLQEPKA